MARGLQFPGSGALAALASLTLLSACSTEDLRVSVLRPAEVDLSRYRTLSVVEVTGEGGAAIASGISAGLARSGHFTLVDRRDSAARLEEIRRTRGGNFDPSTLPELGRQIGALALIQGEVTVNRYSESESKTDRVGLRPVDKNGKVELEEYNYVEWTRHGELQLVVDLRVTATATGEVLFSRTLRRNKFDETVAYDTAPDPIDPRALLDASQREIIQEFVSSVTPREEYVVVTLYKDSDIPLLAAGNNDARLDDWDAAIATYREALDLLPAELADYRYMPLFNLGVAYAYTNRFEEARTHLKEAYRLAQDRMILDQLESLKRLEREYEELRRQGLAN